MVYTVVLVVVLLALIGWLTANLQRWAEQHDYQQHFED
jgi:hypothetical protein